MELVARKRNTNMKTLKLESAIRRIYRGSLLDNLGLVYGVKTSWDEKKNWVAILEHVKGAGMDVGSVYDDIVRAERLARAAVLEYSIGGENLWDYNGIGKEEIKNTLNPIAADTLMGMWMGLLEELGA